MKASSKINNVDRAADLMRAGGTLMKMHSGTGLAWYILPEGEASEIVATKLLACALGTRRSSLSIALQFGAPLDVPRKALQRDFAGPAEHANWMCPRFAPLQSLAINLDDDDFGSFDAFDNGRVRMTGKAVGYVGTARPRRVYSTARRLNTLARRFARLNSKVAETLASVRSGSALLLAFGFGGQLVWRLSNGRRVDPQVAHLLINHPQVAGVGDALPIVGEDLSQTWRYIDAET
jgi:hypothetical protein